MTRRTTIIFGISGYVKSVTLYCHTLFGGGGAEGLGKGCVKITLIVSCLEWLTCSILFIMVEFEKLQPQFKNGTHFSCYERVECPDEFIFNSHMRCYVTQWSVTIWWLRQFVQTPSPGKKKSAYQIVKRGTKALNSLAYKIQLE